MIYGYARVSSKNQAIYGTSLDNQEEMLIKAGADKVFKEAYTGTKYHRPELDKMFEELKEGDTVVVAKLDRIARNAQEGIKIIDEIVDRGCKLVIENMGTFDNTPIGRMTRTMMLAFAEFERDMIFERTQEGKRVKRATDPNYKEGRHKIFCPQFLQCYQMWKDGGKTIEELCKTLGISRSKWYSLVKEMEVAEC